MRIGKGLALIKFRFDLGISFLVLLNMSLLVMTAAPQISELLRIPKTIIIIMGIPLALLGTWTFGFILDKIGFQHGINENLNERNPQIQELLEMNREILEKLKKNG